MHPATMRSAPSSRRARVSQSGCPSGSDADLLSPDAAPCMLRRHLRGDYLLGLVVERAPGAVKDDALPDISITQPTAIFAGFAIRRRAVYLATAIMAQTFDL